MHSVKVPRNTCKPAHVRLSGTDTQQATNNSNHSSCTWVMFSYICLNFLTRTRVVLQMHSVKVPRNTCKTTRAGSSGMSERAQRKGGSARTISVRNRTGQRVITHSPSNNWYQHTTQIRIVPIVWARR